MITDSVGSFLTSIRNASLAKHKKVDVDASRMRIAMLDILKSGGFIKNYKMFRQGKKGVLRVYLRYLSKEHGAITGIERVSKPSKRVYVSYKKIPKVMEGIGLSIISTSKGLVSDESARTEKAGGEWLCKVW